MQSTDTSDIERYSVGRRSVRAETVEVGRAYFQPNASARAGVDRMEMKILPVVAAKSGENPDRLKGKVFPATFFGRELVGPKSNLN